MNPLLCYVRARLQRRLFAWFGATILFTGLAVMLVQRSTEHGEPGIVGELQRASAVVGHRFERVWDSPSERAELAESVSHDLEATVSLRAADGTTLATYGAPCRHAKSAVAPVVREGKVIGSVAVCAERYRAMPARLFVPLLVTGLLLWTASGVIARRLSRPMMELHRVADELGAGNLAARVKLDRHHRFGEAHALAMTINNMAARLERQVSEQRELLAAVSHEMRTPLARIRLIAELARAEGVAEKRLADSGSRGCRDGRARWRLWRVSRLDFQVASRRSLDAAEVASRALERAGLRSTVLCVENGPTPDAAQFLTVSADPTLLGRALANVLDNAKKHGHEVSSLRVQRRGPNIAFLVEDGGPGFQNGDESRVFEPFFRRSDRGSLGLGLSLVQRIAAAHGGRAFAENRLEGGARVGIEIPAT